MILRATLAVLAAAALSWGQPPLSKGFDHFYNLEYEGAIAWFAAEAAKRPDDPALQNHLAQSILYQAMYRAGALESEMVSGTNAFLRREKVNPSPGDMKRFDEAIARSIALCQKRLAANPKDTDALYYQGVAHGLRANYNFLVRKAWLDSLRDATTARKLHQRVTQLDPGFVDARLVQGVHDYVVGSLPFTYKLLGFLVGFRGDREGGIRTLERVAREGTFNKVDAQVLLAVIYRRERRAREAVPMLHELIGRFPRNYLFRFELSQMYADLGDKEKALGALDEVESLKRAGTPGYSRLPWEKIHYARGNVLFWYREYDPALENLRKVTARIEEVDLNTGVFAWLRLGQTLDMKGRREEARAAYRQAVALAPESDAARESRRYLANPYRRAKS